VALDGLGGLPVQVALAVLGGQAGELGRDLGHWPLTAPSEWTMTTSEPIGYSAQVPRLLRAEVVGGPGGPSTRRNGDAATQTSSSATGRSLS
jgi:hypothetical protein